MPKFLNIYFPKSEATYWYLSIDNKEDLRKYNEINLKQNFHSLQTDILKDVSKYGLEKGLSHIGTSAARTVAIASMLQTSILGAAEGEKIYPIVELAKFQDKKYLAQYNMLNNGDTLLINHAGGYCDKEGFLKIHNAQILEEKESDNFGFPVTVDVRETVETVVLENAPETPYQMNHILNTFPEVKNTKIKFLNNLEELDSKYIIAYLKKAKNVMICTNANSEPQVDKFMELFSTIISGKNIYLKIWGSENEDGIKNHPKFKKCKLQNNIIFN